MSNVTTLDGFKAACINVEHALNAAEQAQPRRLKPRFHESAAYRQGLFEGLLYAHCQHSLCEFPEQNAEVISSILKAGNP